MKKQCYMLIMAVKKNRFMTGMSLMFHKILRLTGWGNSGPQS